MLNNYISFSEYFKVLEDEYFSDLIGNGGSAVKFIVSMDDSLCEKAKEKIIEISHNHGYSHAHIKSSDTKLNMVDKIFFDITRQLNWDTLINQFVKNIYENDLGLSIKEGNVDHKVVAEQNKRDAKEILNDFKRIIENNLLKDYDMCKEFRTAVSRLAVSRIQPENVAPSMADELINWLKGEKCNFSNLKKVQIFQKINRSNARHMLSALTRWLKKINISGLIITVDINHLFEKSPKMKAEGEFFYGGTGLLDAYEVMRQFIDNTDETSNLGLIFISDDRFLKDEKRGIHKYDALKFRIYDEVSDKSHVNPFNSLIRVEN